MENYDIGNRISKDGSDVPYAQFTEKELIPNPNTVHISGPLEEKMKELDLNQGDTDQNA